MRYALLILPLLLAGCSGKRYTDVAEYEQSHPYAKRVETVYDLTSGVPVVTRIVFFDKVPSITPGGRYSTTARTDTFILVDGKVTDFVRQDGF